MVWRLNGRYALKIHLLKSQLIAGFLINDPKFYKGPNKGLGLFY